MREGKEAESELARVKGRRVKANVTGGKVSSDWGLVLVREVDRRLGLTREAARALVDERQSGKVRRLAITTQWCASAYLVCVPDMTI